MAAECFYNGVSFQVLYKTRIRSTPVLDEARRTVVYVEHQLTVEGFLSPETPPDEIDFEDAIDGTVMGELRKLLTTPGGELFYSEKGFGDLIVNSDDDESTFDSAWGPIPEVLEWVPLGGDGGAARVMWRVTTRIPECDNARYTKALLAFNFETDFSIDQHGYTSARVSGYIEIPMTRTNVDERGLPDIVDAYRNRITTQPGLGFHRTDQHYRVSKDKRRLDFSWTDTEVPAPLPEGAASIDARQYLGGKLQGGFFARGQFRLDATITTVRGVHRGEALRMFLALLGSRTANLVRPFVGPPAPGEPRQASLLPESFSIDESIFGRETRFSFSGSFLHHGTIGSAIARSNLWRPTGDDFQRWRASMTLNHANGPVGGANSVMARTDDAIIDLCVPPPKSTAPDLRAQPPPGGAPPAPTATQESVFSTMVTGLTALNSWVDYQACIEWVEHSGVVRHRPLPEGATSGSGTGAGVGLNAAPRPTGATGGWEGAASLVRAPGPSGVPQGRDPIDRYQIATSPHRTAILTGHAVRLGFRAPEPRLERIGGVPAVEMTRRVKEIELASYGNLVLFATVWRITYAIAQSPNGNMPYLANPVMGTNGGEGTGTGGYSLRT